VNAFDRARDAAKSSTTPLSKRAETAYAVAKTDDEKRYTLGVLYVPGARDADDEFADAEELQKACWDYVRSGYRAIRDTHTNVEIGELVELVSWPYEVEAEARTGDGTGLQVQAPAENTVYAGVIWQPPAWELYKQGKLRGYSLGGKAHEGSRLQDDSVFEQPALKSKPSKEELSAALDVIARAIEVD
jgi:hypothetical protein